MSTGLEGALQYVRQQGDRFLHELREVVAIPSISTDPARRADMARCAEWFAARLRALGWPVADGLAPGVVAVARRLDTLLHSWVQNGGRVLLLAEGPEAMATSLPRVHITPRAGTPWQGDWASSFAWLRRTGPFATLPGGPLLDLSFSRVIPEHVIAGLSPWDFEADVDAGLCVGWIHKPVGLIVRRRYGQGAAVVTTLRLADEDLGRDPVATALLQGLAARAAE